MISRRRFLPLAAMPLLTPLTRQAIAAEEPFPIFQSEANAVPYRYRKQTVSYETQEPAGTIVINTGQRFLYLVQGGGRVLKERGRFLVAPQFVGGVRG